MPNLASEAAGVKLWVLGSLNYDTAYAIGYWSKIAKVEPAHINSALNLY